MPQRIPVTDKQSLSLSNSCVSLYCILLTHHLLPGAASVYRINITLLTVTWCLEIISKRVAGKITNALEATNNHTIIIKFSPYSNQRLFILNPTHSPCNNAWCICKSFGASTIQNMTHFQQTCCKHYGLFWCNQTNIRQEWRECCWSCWLCFSCGFFFFFLGGLVVVVLLSQILKLYLSIVLTLSTLTLERLSSKSSWTSHTYSGK